MIEFQRKLLGDGGRNSAFYQALKQVIVPGVTTVADIGAGTGFLSFLAEQLGAASCTLYEFGEIAGLARSLIKKNGMKKCRIVAKHSQRVKPSDQVDLVISETLGNFAYEEHILETMADAKRFLKQGGTMIPQRLTQKIAPIVHERLWNEINVWDRVGFGIDFTDAKEIGLNNMYVKTVFPADLLPGSDVLHVWDIVDFREKNSSVRTGRGTWTADEPGTLFGFAVSLDCELVPGITLSTSPFAPATHWEQIVLPLMTPIAFPAKAQITVDVRSDTRPEAGVRVQWETHVAGPDGKRLAAQKMDMQRGML